MTGKKVVKRGRKCVQKNMPEPDDLCSGVEDSSENKKRKTQVSLVTDSKVESCTKPPVDVKLKLDHIRSQPGIEELGGKSETSTNTCSEEPAVMTHDGTDELTTLVETASTSTSCVSEVVLEETNAEVVDTNSSVVDTSPHAGINTEGVKLDEGQIAMDTQISAAGPENPLAQIAEQDTHNQTNQANCEMQGDFAYDKKDLSINPDCVQKTSCKNVSGEADVTGTDILKKEATDDATEIQSFSITELDQLPRKDVVKVEEGNLAKQASGIHGKMIDKPSVEQFQTSLITSMSDSENSTLNILTKDQHSAKEKDQYYTPATVAIVDQGHVDNEGQGEKIKVIEDVNHPGLNSPDLPIGAEIELKSGINRAEDITDSQLCDFEWMSQFAEEVSTGSKDQIDVDTNDIQQESRVQVEDGSAIMTGFIKELSLLNKMVLKTKREMESFRRQRKSASTK